MPTVTWNKDKWDETYDWPQSGDEWSRAWGGPRAQWSTCILPRVAAFLPASSVLEIAPGYGRWTEHLLPQSASYTGVDLSESCVHACAERFADQRHATFAVNDGMTLPMITDGSIDFIFSFDSLVHVEAEVIGSYLREFSRVLSPDGVAFIHHSNAGAYRRSARWRDALAKATDPIPAPREALACAGLAHWHKSRGRSMTAQRFAAMAGKAGLACTGQEVIGWASPLLIDCISTVTRPGSRWDRPATLSRNRYFWLAAFSARAAAQAFEL
jgi:ubiquinone/menaquinone biosynthesis C-methylase UbiE